MKRWQHYVNFDTLEVSSENVVSITEKSLIYGLVLALHIHRSSHLFFSKSHFLHRIGLVKMC